MWPWNKNRAAARARDMQERLRESFGGALNALEKRIDRLEEESAGQRVTLLATVDKVIHSLQARDAARARLAKRRDEEEEPEPQAPQPRESPPLASSAHLSKRFRSW